MCKVEMLKALLSQRLSAAVEEIFQVLERTMAEYEEELGRTKAENERQRQLLDAVFKPRADVADASEKDLHPEQQLRSSEMEQQEQPELLLVKVEEDEGHIIELPLTTVAVKNEGATEHGGGSQAGSPSAPPALGHNTATRSLPAAKSLTTRKRRATKEKSHYCSVCGKGFCHKESLVTHTRTHTGEKPFSCSVCNASFTDRSTLIRHVRRHTGEKPFSCPACGKRFSVRSNMTTHMRTHTGEKPFACSLCGQRFSIRANLIAHMRTHTGEKVLNCAVCDQRFSYKYQLEKHTCAAGHR